MISRAVALCLLALAACSRSESPVADPGEAPAATPAAAAVPAPGSGLPAYVGRWAETAGLCGPSPWIFTPDRLDTAGETACWWNAGEAVRAGAVTRVAGFCAAESAEKPHALTLTTAPGGAGTLKVEGAPGAPVTLVRCDEAGPAPAAGDSGAPLAEAAAIDRRLGAGPVRAYQFKHELVLHDAWREGDSVLKIRTAEGRSFWFKAGERDPFLAQDAEGAWAFENGRMTWAYDPVGRPRRDLSGPARSDRATRLMAEVRRLSRAAEG
jgi:hypothetical protein